MNRRGNANDFTKRMASGKGASLWRAKERRKAEVDKQSHAMRLCKPLASHACANDGGRSNKDANVSLQLMRSSIVSGKE
jgi:hypothetical protein